MEKTCNILFQVLIFFSIFTSHVYAEQPVDYTDQPLEESLFFSEIPTIVTATRLSQSVASSPVAATVIDRATIEASGFTEIVDLLRLVPGFQVAHVAGNTFSATYHGHGWEYPARLQVLVNGRSVYLSMFSTVDWDFIGIHMEDIERIEVIRGPNAPAYGSNAFMAAVNIITRTPKLDQTSVSVQAGSRDQLEQVFRYAGSKQDIGYRFSVFSRKHDGQNYRNDHRDIKGFNMHAVSRPTGQDELEFEVGYASGRVGALGVRKYSDAFEGGYEENPFFPFRNRKITGSFQNIRWRHSYSEYNDLNIQFYHNGLEQKDRYTLGLSLSEILENAGIAMDDFTAATGEQDQEIEAGMFSGISERYDLDIQHTYISPKQLQVSWGGGLRLDSLDNSDPAFSEKKLKDYSSRVFFNSVIPVLTKTDVNVGFILENNHLVRKKISPRLAVNQRITDYHSLRFSVAKAYRVPSLLEANFNYQTRLSSGYILDQVHISSPDMETEVVRAADFGYLGRFKKTPVNWEIKVFYESTKNVISTRQEDFDDIDGKARVWLNSGMHENTGLEGQLIYRPTPENFLSLQFSHGRSIANYGYDKRPWRKRTTRIGMPRNNIGLLASRAINQFWQLSAGVYRNGKMEWESAGEIVEGYTRVDVKLSREFNLLNKSSLKLSVGVQNLDNEYYEFDEFHLTVPHYYVKANLFDF